MANNGILVTGAAGFVGAHVARELAGRKIPMAALVRSRASADRLGPLNNDDIVETDITDTYTVTRAIERIKPRIVINAASYGVNPREQDPDLMTAVNVTAVRTLLKAARAGGATRFIQLGSCSEYGDHPAPLDENTTLNPKNAYAATKAEASALAAQPNAEHPDETLVLRLFNVWGPLEGAHRLIPQVIESCLTKTGLALTAGTQEKDYTFAPDLARWIVDVALLPEPYRIRVVNCASGRMMAVKELVLAVAKALGGEHLMRFGAKTIPLGEVQTGPADPRRITALLPDRRFTPFEDAVRQTITAAGAC